MGGGVKVGCMVEAGVVVCGEVCGWVGGDAWVGCPGGLGVGVGGLQRCWVGDCVGVGCVVGVGVGMAVLTWEAASSPSNGLAVVDDSWVAVAE